MFRMPRRRNDFPTPKLPCGSFGNRNDISECSGQWQGRVNGISKLVDTRYTQS